MVSQQVKWVCPSSHGNHLWRIHPVPISRTSVRTGRELGREMPEKQEVQMSATKRGGERGRGREPLLITEDWSWEDPVETGSASFRGKESATGSQIAAGLPLCPIHSTPPSLEGWWLSSFKFKGKNHSRWFP